MRSLLSIGMLAVVPAFSQAPATTVKFSPDKGVVVKNDSTFQMTVRFRMQERMAFFSEGGDDLSITGSELRTRRARLRFDGFILTPRLQYKLQFGFSKADMDIQDGTEDQHPLRDATLTYALTRNWSIGFGQGKLPGNRQRVISSNLLELPDRSIVNGAFTLDRDFGLFLTWQRELGHQLVRAKGALSSGEGRDADPGDAGLCYTGRVEWLPFGAFTNEGDYFEGDLERERTVKLSLAGTYSTNQDARRANGQLGEAFALGQQRTINTAFVDAMAKYNGWSLLAEYADRRAEGSPIVADPLTAGATYVHEGWGLNLQLGRMVGKRSEVAARYSIVAPGSRVKSVMRQREESWLGYTYYVNQHRIKLQSALSYAWRDGTAALDHAGNGWGLWFQVELGL